MPARPPRGARRKRPGPWWLPTELVFLNNDQPKPEKLARILEDPGRVLDGLVPQQDTLACWCPERRIFVLRNGNHRLRVARTLQRPLFLAHVVLTAGDEGWLEFARGPRGAESVT